LITLPTLAAGEILLPDTLRITPSNINPWRGLRREGQLFTDAQLKYLASVGSDPLTVEWIALRDAVTQREYWWPKGSKPPVYVMPCPVLEQQPDKTRVLTPAAFIEWVRGTEVRRPKGKYK
jgi:hypothetical protein